jgi:hypothetical protein
MRRRWVRDPAGFDLFVAVQGAFVTAWNLPFVQLPPEADLGPEADRQLQRLGTKLQTYKAGFRSRSGQTSL